MPIGVSRGEQLVAVNAALAGRRKLGIAAINGETASLHTLRPLARLELLASLRI
jgi:hypothetical protein